MAVVWPLAARAQQTMARQVRVGLITPMRLTPAMLSAFRNGMRERGYVEGQNLSIDVRWPQGSFEQNPGVVAPARVPIKSTVGTGDAMVAGIVHARLQNLGVEECARLATAFSLGALGDDHDCRPVTSSRH